jgi:prohibitin 1
LIAKDTMKELSAELQKRGIIPEQILLSKIELPKNLTTAIENKLAMEQESERMKFVLVKEQQEAERKKIMAKGIADFQEIVAHGVNEDFLRWKGIEATEKLAASTNAKVVVIGSGKDGLPLILGGGGGGSSKSSW